MPENLDQMLRRTSRPTTTLEDAAYRNTERINYSDVNAVRFPRYQIGLDNEEIYAQQQSAASKWGNGFVKGLGLTGTTFINGTVGLAYGVYSAISDGDFNSFYDNEVSKSLNDYNSYMEDRFANYYSKSETNAAWYSPDTWRTANFWSDTILKNIGFAAGAYLSGKVLTGAGSSLLNAVRGTTASQASAIDAAARASVLSEAALVDDAGFLAGRTGLATAANTESQIAARAAQIEAYKQWGKNMTHAVLSASGEAQIEAYQAKDEYRTKMLDEFKNKMGRAPDANELQEIDNTASEIGNATFAGNMAILTATNFIQFPKLAKTASAEARVVGQSERQFFSNVVDKDGNTVRRAFTKGSNLTPNTAAGEKLISSTGTNIIGNQLDRFSVGRVLNKVSPWTRMIFSPSEALEEGAQTFIPNLAEAYFANGSNTKGDISESFKKSLAETLDSKDFWVALISGGITGGLMENFNPLNGGFAQPIRNRRATQAKANEFVNAVNNNPIGGYITAVAQGQVRTDAADKKAKEAVLSGDKLSLEDALTDQRFSYLAPRIQYGRKDLVDADIQNWRDMASTSEGWQKLQKDGVVEDGIIQQEFLQGLDKMQTMSDTLSAKFEALNLRYANSRNEDGTPTHNKEVISKMAYVATKIDDYNNRLGSLSASLSTRGVMSDSLTSFLNNPQAEIEGVNPTLLLPNNEIFTLVDNSPQSKAAAVSAYIEASDRLLEEYSNMTRDEIDTAIDDLGDLVGLVANRSQFIEEYKRIRENPNRYEDADIDPIDYVEEEPDEDTYTPPTTITGVKKDFYEAHKGEDVTLDFGQRGIDSGTIVYDPSNNILAVERTDGSLYEITNQDFKDGVVRFTDPNTRIEQEFLEDIDPRTEVKRIETVREIRDSLREQQEKLNQSRERTGRLREKVERVKEGIQNTSSESTKTYSDLQQERYDKLLKVQNSAQAKKLREQYLNGQISNEELNTSLKVLQEREGIPAIEQRLSELDKTMTSYEDMGKSVEELTDIHNQLQEEITEQETEQQEIERQIAIYNDILVNPFSDYNKVLNEIEQQLFQLADLRDDLTKHQGSLQRLLGDVKKAITSFAKLLKDKAQISNIPASSLITRAADYVIENIQGSVPNDLINTVRDITSKLSVSEAQKNKLSSELNTVQQELDAINQDIESRLNVYEQLLNRANQINHPLDPAYFSDTIENAQEQPVDEEVTDESTNETRGFFNGAKKLLSRLFKSTVVLPDMRIENTPMWYKKYGKTLKNIATLPYSERQNLRVRLITARNEASQGLTGLIDSVTNNYHKTEASKLDPNDGTIVAVISKARPDGTEVYLDENLNELTNPTIDTVVLTKLANTELNFRNSQEENYSKPEQVSQSPQELALAYSQLRADIMQDTEVNRSYPFSISRGQLPDPSNNDTQIVGNLVHIEDLSTRPLLRLVKKGESYETPDGDTISPQKGSVLLLNIEDSAQPVYVSRINKELADGIINALESISTNIQNNQGYDSRMMSFVDSMLPYGTRFDKTNLTLTKGKEIIDLKNLDFQKELIPLLTNSKVRVDIPMMTPFTEFDGVGIATQWNTFQEFLLNNSDREAHVYTKEAKFDKQHRYLILQNFFDATNTPDINQVVEAQTLVDPLETLAEQNPEIDINSLRDFVQQVSKEETTIEDMLDIDGTITKYDC